MDLGAHQGNSSSYVPLAVFRHGWTLFMHRTYHLLYDHLPWVVDKECITLRKLTLTQYGHCPKTPDSPHHPPYNTRPWPWFSQVWEKPEPKVQGPRNIATWIPVITGIFKLLIQYLQVRSFLHSSIELETKTSHASHNQARLDTWTLSVIL